MGALDGLVIAVYVIATLAWGARHARRAGHSSEQYFAAGRTLPWWLAGTSMVATTFAADTPLAIAGLVASEGIAGNWFWWADVLPSLIAALVIAELWRRSGVLTDNELSELRYAGRRAAGLRIFRAFYFGVLRNAIVIGWVNLAMLKVLSLALGVGPEGARQILVALFVLTVAYTWLAGLWGVILTDALQFVLAMCGAVGLAWLAVHSSGGLAGLLGGLEAASAQASRDTLALVPTQSDAFWAFVIYLGVKSWASGNTEGNGYLAQRLLSTKDDRHARLAALWYAIAHFALRPWPWILVGLVAALRYPELADPEGGYVRVMLDELPPGVLGLMLATLFAAFMSTVDTQLNWGASYLTHDVYRRFIRPAADERELVSVARLSVLALALLGVVATLFMPSIEGAWKFLSSILAGTGLVLLARWLWWRVNAWSEIAVMASSLLATNALALWSDVSFPFSLLIVVAISLPVALAATLLTAPEPLDTLTAFYRQVRPPGFWGPVARACGLEPRRQGWRLCLDVGVGTAAVYACLLGTGQMLLGSAAAGIAWLALGLAGIAWIVPRRAATRSK